MALWKAPEQRGFEPGLWKAQAGSDTLLSSHLKSLHLEESQRETGNHPVNSGFGGQ